MALQPGDKLGPYECIALIGKGGMGKVYKARDTRIDRIVALKVSAAQFSERFEREAKAIGSLNHPNICQLYDVGASYLVMEYIEGTPLRGPLPVDQALKYAAQICAALDAAHRKGITHRDLKPANILVTKAGIKLLDFGLAKLGTSGIGQAPKTATDATLTMALTGKNEIVGTLYYMSPEQLQAQANGQEIDGRSDIFSFGLVLYEILTGKRAFEGASPASVIAAIMERPAPSIAEIAPPALDRVLRKCLAKDPDKRWQSAGDLKDELEWIASPSGAQVPETLLPGGPGRSTLQWVVTASAIVFFLLAAALAFRHFGRPPELKPLVRLSVDLGPEAVDDFRSTAVISPDGTRLVFRTENSLAMRWLNESPLTMLSGTEGGTDPFFSPDGQWIGFFAGGKMKKIAVQGGAPITICDAPNSRGASWGEDENIVFTPTNTAGLSRVPAAGGTSQTLTRLQADEVTHRWPQVLPSGNTLFIASAGTNNYEEASINVYSAKTGTVKTLLRGGYYARYIAGEGTLGHLIYIHQGRLNAVAFDAANLQPIGTPLAILEDMDSVPGSGAGHFEFSRNGTFVYRSGTLQSQGYGLVWIDASGKTQPLLVKRERYAGPRLSPDGRTLAVAMPTNQGVDIFVYDLQRGALSRLTYTGQGNFPFVWAPDGRHLAYRTSVQSIMWIRADGAGEPQRLLQSNTTVLPTSFSPDGRRLAYQTGTEIWILPIDMSDPEHPKAGKPEQFLGSIGANQTDAAFSLDGRWIAYGSNESGVGEIYVRPFPGPGAKWQISNGAFGAFGANPMWSRNGRELFYIGRDGRIMVVEYTARGEVFMAGKPRAWLDTPLQGTETPIDLALDGKRFIVPAPEGQGAPKSSLHVTFLLNFADELRRRIPTGK